jgi:acyl-CoA thioester hydrolase
VAGSEGAAPLGRFILPMRHLTTARPRYGDTDQGGVIHHRTAIDWFEVGRTEMLRDAGFSYAVFERDLRLRLPVVEAHAEVQIARFLRRRSRDRISWVTDVGRVRFTVRHRILDRATSRLIPIGHTALACTDFSGKVRGSPPELSNALVPFVEPSVPSGRSSDFSPSSRPGVSE